jgi:Spy/CpxP family protein refolding chaperone
VQGSKEDMKRHQWTAAVAAVLLFCCGAAVGALAHRYYASTIVSAKTAEDFRHHYVSEMRSKLSLTPSQVTQLETILDETKRKFKAVRDSYHPAMLKIKEEQISRVKSILTPQQIPMYEQLVAEREQRMKTQEERERREQKHPAARRQDSGH